jgi:hypothetical protein
LTGVEEKGVTGRNDRELEKEIQNSRKWNGERDN